MKKDIQFINLNSMFLNLFLAIPCCILQIQCAALL